MPPGLMPVPCSVDLAREARGLDRGDAGRVGRIDPADGRDDVLARLEQPDHVARARHHRRVDDAVGVERADLVEAVRRLDADRADVADLADVPADLVGAVHPTPDELELGVGEDALDRLPCRATRLPTERRGRSCDDSVRMTAPTHDWHEWHHGVRPAPRARSRAGSPSCRSASRAALDAAPPGPIRVVSMCAGEGRDLLGVLEDHPRRADVRGPAGRARPRARGDGPRARARRASRCCVGDAGTTASYAGAVPADLVLVCGVFGNITDADMMRTIDLAADAVRAGRARRSGPGTAGRPTRRPRVRQRFAGERLRRGRVPRARRARCSGSACTGSRPRPARSGPTCGSSTSSATATLDDDVCAAVRVRVRRRPGARSRRGCAPTRTPFVAKLATFDDTAVRRRPAPEVWSPLEYACHVRDVLRVQTERVAAGAAGGRSVFVPMGRDERVVDDRYNEQDPTVGRRASSSRRPTRSWPTCSTASTATAGSARACTTTPSRRSAPSSGSRSTPMHELLHHRGDIWLTPRTIAPMSFGCREPSTHQGQRQSEVLHMRKVVAYELLSLDGVAEKPDGFIADWDDAMDANLGCRHRGAGLGHPRPAQLRRVGRVLAGQRRRAVRDVHQRRRAKYVATSTPLDREWEKTTVVDGELVEFVRDLKNQPGAEIGVHAEHLRRPGAACRGCGRRAQAGDSTDDRGPRAQAPRRRAGDSARDDPEHDLTDRRSARRLPRSSGRRSRVAGRHDRTR